MRQHSNDAPASDADRADRASRASRASRANLDGAVADVAAAVMAASRLFVAISARALADITPALTVQQLRTLVVLEAQGPIKLAELAAALTVNPSTAMRTVDKLEALGLVDRQVNPGNRREVVLRLTADGRNLVAQVMTRRHQEIATIVARLPADQRTGLVQALQALITAADEPAIDPLSAPDLFIDHP
ncbi:MarR family transcriptional regulator [Streptomyces sp. RB6PN25]|uniref:MarR family transcriptional regulator n=1 Tax=Streptomyces humicola TaxID=2953240 RepID=A0ABT1PN85_9ACTN|nr:MarR family transcriptional regulator [Streptomyces humicola]MCQ4079138.1 MarR family transcriptional regulator [Streptomyces humicola]